MDAVDKAGGESGASLVSELRRATADLAARITGHRFVAALEQGRVGRGALRAFASWQSRIVGAGTRSLALLLSRCPRSGPARDLVRGFLEAELVVEAEVDGFARALGAGGGDVPTEPEPGADAFGWCVSHLCLHGSAADLSAAFLLDSEVWIPNATRVAAALRTRYGLDPDAVRFLELYSGLGPPEDAVEAAVREAVGSGEPFGQVLTAVRSLLTAELWFWDAAWRRAESGGPG